MLRPTKEQAHAGLWRLGKLDWKFKPIQNRLYDAYQTCRSFLFVSLVARQTGKSFTWATLALETCIRKPKARVRYGTAFHSDLEEFIRPIFDLICEDAPVDVKPRFHRQGSKYIFPNGSEIKLVGLDINPDGIRGNALDLVIIDEAGFVSRLRYVYSIIIAMLRHRPHLRVVMSSTPSETPDHEFTEFVQEADAQGALFKATIDDDETCTQETKARIEKECGGLESTTYKREFLCQFVVDSDLAIIPEWNESFVKEAQRDDFFSYYHRYASMDLGVVDFTAALFGYYDFKRATLVIEDEVSMRGPTMTTDKLASVVKAKERDLWGDAKVYRRIADSDNPLLLNDLGSLHDVHFRATDKDELPAMVNEVRLLTKQGRLQVDPKCRMLIGCLQYGIYNGGKFKREFARSKVYGHYDHLAALVYLVRNLDVHTNPVPGNLGQHYSTHHIRQDNILSGNAAKMAKIMNKSFSRGLKQ